MSPRTQERGAERIELPPGYSFAAATKRALQLAAEGQHPPYVGVLSMLSDLPDIGTDLLDRMLEGTMTPSQLKAISSAERVGASYKQLALIAHLAGFSDAERYQFYELAQSIGLSGRHAGHLIRKLKSQGEGES